MDNNLDFFNKQISCSISYQRFICDYYSKDEKTVKSNQSLLSTLYEIKSGACVNPSLIEDLIYPANAKIGKLRAFRPTNNDIDDSKKKAIKMALATDNLMVLEGPPGSGKTTVIIELIRQLKLRNKSTRMLITSQSHIAVDNVIEDFIDKNIFLDQIARIRRKENNDDSKFQPYSETAIFENLYNKSDDRLKAILSSYNNNEDEKFGNDFLKYNISMVLTDKSIVGVTCNSIPSCHFENGDPFDYVVVDEVGKFSFCELMNVAKIAKKLILIGDPKQLPAVIADHDQEKNIDFCNVEGFKTDDFEFLKTNNYVDYLFSTISKSCSTKLNRQYRMSNAIGKYISQKYYSDMVLNGRDKEVKDAINFISYKVGFDKVRSEDKSSFSKINDSRYYDCKYSKIEQHENMTEINIIRKLLHDKNLLGNVDKDKIAIITPFRKQAEKIRNNIKEIAGDRISTVDAFQGKEYDYVIFSCTRTAGNSYFIDNWKRINVAVSRAKNKFFLIGYEKYLLQNTKNIKSIINFNVKNYEHPISHEVYSYACKKWFWTGDRIINK